MFRLNLILTLLIFIIPKVLFASQWIEGNKLILQGLDKITARIKTIEVNIQENYSFGVLNIFVERCLYSKPIFKPESLAFIRIKDNSDRLSEVKFEGWMFASSPALNALENSVYDISILACKKVKTHSKKLSSFEPKEQISTSN